MIQLDLFETDSNTILDCIKKIEENERNLINLMDQLDLWVDSDGYPTEAALEYIRTATVIEMVMAKVKDIWALGKPFKSTTDDTYVYSTYGWSGNESIIRALKENLIIWGLIFISSRAGGHYIFSV